MATLIISFLVPTVSPHSPTKLIILTVQSRVIISGSYSTVNQNKVLLRHEILQ